MGVDPGIMTQLLKSFVFTFSSGGARLVPDALLILGLLAVIELALVGLWLTWGEGQSVAGAIVKLVGIAFVAVLIQKWAWLTKVVIDGFIGLGLKAGGDLISITDFTDPGNIAAYGFSVTGTIFDRLMSYTGWQAIQNIPEIVLAGPIALLIVAAYFALAIWIFVTLIEFYAHAAITTVLLPFAISPKVAFLAEKSIAVIFASGMRLLVLSFITAATLPILVAQQPGLNPSLKSILGQLLGAAAICCLAWRADKSSQALLHGAPRLTIQDVVQFAQSARSVAGSMGGAAHAAREIAAGRTRII